MVVAPQNSNGWFSNVGMVHEVVTRVQADHRIDVDRTYGTGVSDGATGLWTSTTRAFQRPIHR